MNDSRAASRKMIDGLGGHAAANKTDMSLSLLERPAIASPQAIPWIRVIAVILRLTVCRTLSGILHIAPAYRQAAGDYSHPYAPRPCLGVAAFSERYV